MRLSLERIFLVISEALARGREGIGCLLSSIPSDFPSRLLPVSAGGEPSLGALWTAFSSLNTQQAYVSHALWGLIQFHLGNTLKKP